MQFTKPQIAALVLGFLKAEKLLSVVDEFVKTCSYFQENSHNIKMGKYFVTRIAGMSLVDFLEEYSVVSAIVQSHLEDTPYFETHRRTTLVEQLLFLLDKNTVNVATSTPVLGGNTCGVEATPVHTLPGNSLQESDNLSSKTPKRRSLRNKSREKEKEAEEVMEITEVLTQSLLENHELHEKIAETINIVRNTSEGPKNVIEDHISAGVSRELDAVIKTVIQKTEEDPVYNKLIDEIIGTTTENVPPKKPPLCNTSTPSTSTSTTSTDETNKDIKEKTQKSLPDRIEDHNNDAIRSIVEVALNSEQTSHPEPSSALTLQTQSNEVYFFDGTLDTYLKSTGARNPVPTNSLYINSNSLYVVPPEQKQQYYIVNNQPLLKMSTVLTEKEIMSIPTIIVSDDNTVNVNADVCPNVIDETDGKKRPKRIKPKPAPKKAEAVAKPSVVMATTTCAVASATVTSTVTTVSKQASHVRNLDFSTPRDGNRKKGSWDSDLRQLVKGCKDKSPSPKRKKALPASAKKKKKEAEDKKEEETEKTEEESKTEQVEDELEKHLQTPIKDVRPKTPSLDTSNNMQCTPFTALLEEQLQGVDLTSIPTPSIPITPGFALTPGMCHRNTDYSTASSSYYVPSDSEQPKSMDEVLEESREKDKCEEKIEKNKQVKILSDVVIEKPITEPVNEHLKKFNNHVIGKKNLSLIKSSIELSSESEEEGNKTSDKTEGIKDILNKVEVKNTLDEKEARKKSLLAELEIKRQRTVKKIKSEREPPRKQPKRNTKKKEIKEPPKKAEKPKKLKKGEDEAQKLVKDLAQRGIHLIPNKKNEEENCLEFDKKVFESGECVVFDEKKEVSRKFYDLQVLKKSMSVQVFLEDVNKQVSRTIKWTDCDSLLDSENFEIDLMDEVVIGRSVKESHDKKGARKRKRTEDDSKQTEKKNKMMLKNNLKLLKKINVDDFLSKVHGE